MADLKPILSLVIVDQTSKLKDFAIGHQQLIFCEDKRKIALDFDGRRRFYNQIEVLELDADRETCNPVNGVFYFVLYTAVLFYYEDGWIQVTSRPSEITFIGETELPEIGKENHLYVSRTDGIMVWDNESKVYEIVADKTENVIQDIGTDYIKSLFN